MPFDDEPTQLGKKLKDLDTLTPLQPQEEVDHNLKDLVYKLRHFLNNNPEPTNWSPRVKELMGLLLGSVYDKINE